MSKEMLIKSAAVIESMASVIEAQQSELNELRAFKAAHVSNSNSAETARLNEIRSRAEQFLGKEAAARLLSDVSPANLDVVESLIKTASSNDSTGLRGSSGRPSKSSSGEPTVKQAEENFTSFLLK